MSTRKCDDGRPATLSEDAKRCCVKKQEEKIDGAQTKAGLNRGRQNKRKSTMDGTDFPS